MSNVERNRIAHEMREHQCEPRAEDYACASARDLMVKLVAQPLSADDFVRLLVHVSECESCANLSETLEVIQCTQPVRNRMNIGMPEWPMPLGADTDID